MLPRPSRLLRSGLVLALSFVLSLAVPSTANAQDAFGWEASVGWAIPTGGTARGRRIGPAGHLALRLARPSSSVTFGALADVGYMPGEKIPIDALGHSLEQSSLRASTLAATTHFESSTAGPGAFAEIGTGVSWLTQTKFSVSTTAPMLLAGVGVRAPLAGIPLRLGLQYHLYLSDLVEGVDHSVRISIGVGGR